MAEHLASIFGTENDRVNCPFYFKIGAYRCFRLHTPSLASVRQQVGNAYDQFREEDHAAAALQSLTGRFYADPLNLSCLNTDDYIDELILFFVFTNCFVVVRVGLSLVTDFREATGRQYEENVCNRRGYCNFMHLKKISRELRTQLFGAEAAVHRDTNKKAVTVVALRGMETATGRRVDRKPWRRSSESVEVCYLLTFIS
ncbi:Splicing factor U2af small subunit B [Linum perenne]